MSFGIILDGRIYSMILIRLPLEKKKKELLSEFPEIKNGTPLVFANAMPFTGEKYGAPSYLLRCIDPVGEYTVTFYEVNLRMHCFSIAE